MKQERRLHILMTYFWVLAAEPQMVGFFFFLKSEYFKYFKAFIFTNLCENLQKEL